MRRDFPALYKWRDVRDIDDREAMGWIFKSKAEAQAWENASNRL